MISKDEIVALAFFVWTGLLLVILKLAGVLYLSWWIVTLPFTFPLVFIIIGTVFFKMFERRKNDKNRKTTRY
jgi:membrane protein implicated in regulation of membrane protease activity